MKSDRDIEALDYDDPKNFETLEEYYAKKYKWHRRAVLCGVILLVILFIRVVYNQTRTRIVFACPDNSSTKCYELPAKYSVDPPMYDKIFFPNGGSLSFDWCEGISKARTLRCFRDSDNVVWDLTFNGQYAD